MGVHVDMLFYHYKVAVRQDALLMPGGNRILFLFIFTFDVNVLVA